MKIVEICERYEHDERLIDTPLKLSPYQQTDNRDKELMDIVRFMIDSGVMPDEVKVNPKKLHATQDYLDPERTNGPIFPEYSDKPVVLQKDDMMHILDGHHRSSKALAKYKPIKIYLFKGE